MKTIDAITIVEWYVKEETQKRLQTLPIKEQWVIRKNLKALESIVQNFNNFRNDLAQKRNEEWFNEKDGKCYKTKTDQGKDVLQIKDEYKDDLKAYDDKVNTEIFNILEENIDTNLTAINIDNLIEAVDNNCKIELIDLEMLEKMGVSE